MTVANLIGGAGKMDAKSAATRRQAPWQYWMTVIAGQMDETAWVDRRLVAARMQCFRLMKRLLAAFSPANPAGPPRRLMSESARRSYFRRKCCSQSATQRVYGRRHNLYNKFFSPCNWMTNGPRIVHRTRQIELR